MKYLKIALCASGLLCLFALNGCDGGTSSSSGSGSAEDSSKLSQNVNNGTIIDPIHDATSFNVRNETGKKVTRLEVLSNNGTLIDIKQLDCVKKCKIKIDEGEIKGDLTFKFFGSDDEVVARYLWPYGVGRRFAIEDISSSNKLGSLPSVNDEPGTCSATADDGIFGALSAFSSMIPGYGVGLSALFSVGEGVMSDACAAGGTNIQDTINILSSRIDKLDSEMKVMNYDIDEITEEIYLKDVSTKVNIFKTDIMGFQGMAFTYDEIFYDPSESATSMADYVQKHGGFNVVFGLNVPFTKTITTTTDQVNAFNSLLLLDLTDLEGDLQTVCSNPSVIAGDVISTRVNCDLTINYLTTKSSITADQAKLMLEDEINTMLQALHDPKSGIDAKWLAAHGMEDFYYGQLSEGSPVLHISWEDALAWVDTVIDAKVKNIKEVLIGNMGKIGAVSPTPKMFLPLDGFDPDLSASMIAHKCYLPQIQLTPNWNKPTMVNQPSVLEWYANPNTPKGGPYIVTNCFDGEDFIKSIYYTNGGNKITNILGGLVPNDFMNKKVNAAPILGSLINTNDVVLSTFNLTSKYPIKINSITVRTFDNAQSSMRTPDIVSDGKMVRPEQYGSINPAYYDSIQKILLPLELISDSGVASLSSLLEPVSNSSIQFVSKVYNSLMRSDSEVPSILDEVVYLSFQKNGITYVFGLHFRNISKYYVVTPTRGISPQEEDINLQCLSNAGCKADPSVPTQIIWGDGTFANLTKVDDNNVTLSFDNK